MTTTSFEQQINKKLWFAAIKPPMYSVAVVPIWVGTAMAYADTQKIYWSIFLTFLSAAIFIIAWLNLSNDVFDADTGIDKNKAHSVVNLTQNKALVFWISNFCLLLGLGGILAIALWQQDMMVIGIVLLCCALGYTYQGPPFRLGYQGLGEIICFICFGPLAIAAAYYSQTQTFSIPVLIASTLIGLTTSIILFCSHFHQVQDDVAAGKRSPIVRLGTALGARVLAWSTGIIFALTVLFICLGYAPLGTILIFFSLPIAYQLVSHVNAHHDQPKLVSNCKFIAVKLHFWTGLLWGLGFMIPGVF
ncbi:MAG: 2-carboxy-1,4-naphthoquinone phytyltransferase [Spirulinaceae cyanobacterium]